jgi:hypothetical protein
MNRDRTIIVVLAVLLLGSLLANAWLLKRSPRPVPSAGEGTPSARVDGPRERGTSAAYEIVANPEMKGRLGRIVITFAGEEKALSGTRTAIYKPGAETLVKAEYGPVAAELIAGDYDLEVSGRKVAGVPVEAGKDTRIASGALRLHGAANTRFVIYPAGEAEKYLYVDYGNGLKGLPVGEYEVEVSGQREKVTVEAGKVTDF